MPTLAGTLMTYISSIAYLSSTLGLMICSLESVVFHLVVLSHNDAHQGQKIFSQYTMPFCDMMTVTIIVAKVCRHQAVCNACNPQPFLGLHQKKGLYLAMLVLLLH